MYFMSVTEGFSAVVCCMFGNMEVCGPSMFTSNITLVLLGGFSIVQGFFACVKHFKSSLKCVTHVEAPTCSQFLT